MRYDSNGERTYRPTWEFGHLISHWNVIRLGRRANGGNDYPSYEHGSDKVRRIYLECHACDSLPVKVHRAAITVSIAR